MAMMTLGLMVFEIGTLPYQELTRQTDWRYAQSERFGARKASQFLGVGDDKITLTGALYAGVIGKYSSLATLRTMADSGEAHALMSGTGAVMGNWLVKSLSERQSHFYVDGLAKKADFTIELERADDDAPNQTGGAVNNV